jgi:hypothetical protein
MKTYRRKPEPVRAFQWNVTLGEVEGVIRCPNRNCQAEGVPDHFALQTPSGLDSISSTDWVLVHEDGTRTRLTDARFRAEYEPQLSVADFLRPIDVPGPMADLERMLDYAGSQPPDFVERVVQFDDTIDERIDTPEINAAVERNIAELQDGVRIITDGCSKFTWVIGKSGRALGLITRLAIAIAVDPEHYEAVITFVNGKTITVFNPRPYYVAPAT